MNEKKYKTREEWKMLINGLSATDFQNLVYDLLNAFGFKGVKQRGGGADGGRDLEAIFTYNHADGTPFDATCWFQCKKQANGVSFPQISTDIHRASAQKIDEYYVLSNFDTTPDCKNEFVNGKSSWSCKIIDWTGLKFQDLLFQNPNICNYYFPDEEAPPIIDKLDSKRIAELPVQIENGFRNHISIRINKKVDPNNPQEIADALKDALLAMTNIDINLKALVYQKTSMYFFALDRTDDALLLLDKSLEITPKNVEALLNKGYILEKTNKVEQSTYCYDEIIKIDAKNKFALNNKSANLARAGDLDSALKLVNIALETDPDYVIAINNKANILKNLNKTSDGITFLLDKRELLQKSVILQNKLVDLYIDIIDLKEAYRINEEILIKNPDNSDAINNLGVIFETNSRFQKREKYLPLALDAFEEAIKKNNRYPLGWANKVAILTAMGKNEEAANTIDMAYDYFPNDPYVISRKGQNLLEIGDFKNAYKYFIRALELGHNKMFFIHKAEAQMNLRQWDQARLTCEEILRHDPEDSIAWNIKGHALRWLRQNSKSRICFKNAEKFADKAISLLEDDNS